MFNRDKAARAAFREEALPHLDALFGVALRLTKNERDAEDLVQETFLKAFHHFDKYQKGTNCKAWLFKILTNAFINRYRKRQKERTFLADDEPGAGLDAYAAPEAGELDRSFESPEELFHNAFSDDVRAALEAIPVDFRMVVLLADLQDFSYREIAEIMDCPIGTVMSRLYRGRRLLQRQLVDYAVSQGYLQLDPRSEDEEGKLLSLAEYRRKLRDADEGVG
ncbi:MAG: sigma-70 family RNA polymerase sigma factor [Myxococcota bacterium]|jgi:RNA polymerase sigma-70 factor (ECF subfamily)|nr:sigma-70 family RNA polymerase sigma factor [Myxococcota bacterium]